MLRTFSKIYGLAGLRVGYARRPAGCGRRDEQGAPIFDVTATAQEAAMASSGTRGHSAQASTRTRAARAARRTCASTGSSRPAPRSGNFVYAEVGDGRARLRAAAAARRDRPPLDGFGAPERDRVRSVHREENDVIRGRARPCVFRRHVAPRSSCYPGAALPGRRLPGSWRRSV